MVVKESEAISQSEVESPLQTDQQTTKNHPFSSLGRQSSIYSLTLDEFQHTLCDSGKNFGSMNMDEFLTSIWNAEENQATATINNDHITHTSNTHKASQTGGFADLGIHDYHRSISKQPSLPRQGSLTLPAPLCQKTVDEVWSEIHREKQRGQGRNCSSSNNNSGGNNVLNNELAPRQPTFGEMTLEDFLIKAGVVREQCAGPSAALPSQQQFGLFNQNVNSNSPGIGEGFLSRPVLGMSVAQGGGGGNYPGMAQQSGSGGTAEVAGRNGGFAQQAAVAAPLGTGYGCSVGNGGGYAANQGIGVVGQVSPVSSEAVSSGVDGAGGQFGVDIGGLRGRKRIVDAPVEKVVERRQRRMIKNRESAARSRARKQAYTVELEAELNQLKEENNQLRHALAELERKRKQQSIEDVRMKSQSKAQKAKEKLRILRRNLSWPL